MAACREALADTNRADGMRGNKKPSRAAWCCACTACFAYPCGACSYLALSAVEALMSANECALCKLYYGLRW